MKFNIKDLEKYIELKHSYEEFGDIMTSLEFMQDGPIKGGIIDLEVRQNRPDALSLIGIAREYAAYTKQQLKLPNMTEDFGVPITAPNKLFEVDEKENIKRFTAVKIENVLINKSPEYITNALVSAGIRTVNSAVDITNFVMLEFGIPMHIFDSDKLEPDKNGVKIHLRMGLESEQITTWLGDQITLTNEDIVLVDGNNKPVGIGGVTGEKNSGTTSNTTNIILEAANYDQSLSRQSANRHNLMTDSAIRHSKFLSSDLVELAIKRATYLILEICGGEIKLIEDFYENKHKRPIVDFNISEIERIGGIAVKKENVIDILKRLEYGIKDNNDTLELTTPAHRTDINSYVDVVEDILKLVGYENIPEQKLTFSPPDNITPSIYYLEDKVRDLLVGYGLDEHITESLVQYDKNPARIELENSLNENRNSLRLSIQESLYPTLVNYNKHKIINPKIFEVGKVYYKTNENLNEKSSVGILIQNKKAYPIIKGIADKLFIDLNINNISLLLTNDKTIIDIKNDSELIGFITKVNQNTYYLEITLDQIDKFDINTSSKITTSIPFEHKQDINLTLNKDILFHELLLLVKTIQKEIDQKINISMEFLEEYTNESLKTLNKKAYLISLKFQGLENPISKKDIKPIREKILTELKNQLDIDLKQ